MALNPGRIKIYTSGWPKKIRTSVEIKLDLLLYDQKVICLDFNQLLVL